MPKGVLKAGAPNPDNLTEETRLDYDAIAAMALKVAREAARKAALEALQETLPRLDLVTRAEVRRMLSDVLGEAEGT